MLTTVSASGASRVWQEAGTKICFVCTREQRVNLIKRRQVIASKVNTHLTPRPVLLTRHGQSRDNVRGRIALE
ncbi:hypothetical protein L1987_03783 [Smallanthus sonchifolius]|uniref:Uncharacterized protein n=1 Tax=Smallanthus sonchifolius TaxID=185202 RepID=A0ACB9KBJ6_9ASTR|nr:hypothetical protein L1987_03783 [Smallanthus sonchifolius]